MPPERDELFIALERVLLASPRQASPEDPSWLELLEPGAQLDLDEVTDAYRALLESEEWSPDASFHRAGLWFEFGAWCLDQSKLATWGRLLLLRFGLDLGAITPDQMPLDTRAEPSLQDDLARAIARMDSDEVDVATCVNLIARAREAALRLERVDDAYRLVLLATTLAQWATALHQPHLQSEAEDIAREANHRAEYLSAPAGMRQKLRLCEQELDSVQGLTGERVDSRLRDVATLGRSIADWADKISLTSIRESAHSMAQEADSTVRERTGSVATEPEPVVHTEGHHERPRLALVPDAPQQPSGAPITDFENADTDRFVASPAHATAPPPEPDTLLRENPPPRSIRGRVARGFVAVAAAAAMFMAGWVLNRPQATDAHGPREACMLPSPPENTHFVSLNEGPAEIVTHAFKITVEILEAQATQPSMHNTIHLPGGQSSTVHVQDGTAPMSLRVD